MEIKKKLSWWVIGLLLQLVLASSVPHSFKVTDLPGLSGPLPFNLETGYIEVDELNESYMFYYFVKSERSPRDDPLIVWLTGGPCCSSFMGFAFENGPVIFNVEEYNGSLPTLVNNPNSWTKVANIIYIDAPIGTGYSYSKRLKSYATNDIRSSKEVYQFLIKWFADHPEFLSNSLYIGGDSYSGITVPVLTQEISNGIEVGDEPQFNLKGYLLGNPVTDRDFDDQAKVPYCHGVGLIPDELYELTKRSCNGKYVNPSNEQCAKCIDLVNECVSGINGAHILEPVCFYVAPKPRGDLVGRRSVAEHMREELPLNVGCRSYGYLLSYYWQEDETVRRALHVHEDTVSQWKRCAQSLPYVRVIKSTVNYHHNLTSKGYRALVYSGDHDMIVPHISTQSWIKSLGFSIVDDWRPWSVDGQVAGFTRMYSNNLTFATIKGGGHTAPEYRPKECSAMFRRWISENPL